MLGWRSITSCRSSEGGRIRNGLRESVHAALGILGTGFLRAPGSAALDQAVASGELTAQQLYRELLVLVYRLLFLFVAEERGLMSEHPVYLAHYSARRLRRLAEERGSGTDGYADRWQALSTTFRLLQDESLGATLGLPPLDGSLFSPDSARQLSEAELPNGPLLEAVYRMTVYRDPETNALRRVNYAALDVEELGSVYEGLLEYHPVVQDGEFRLVSGSERKSTGSYYTRPDLVAQLVGTALAPVLEKRLAAAGTPEEKEKAILALNICDPATGSGHFLLATGRRLGRRLAQVRTGEEEPAPAAYREAVRDVIAHCLYGVDVNPLAVDLCRVALWIEGHAEDRPLTFLDHRIKCGNSLLGVLDEEVLEAGIPNGAYKAVEGDDRATAAALRKRNKAERKAWEAGQLAMELWAGPRHSLADALAQLEGLPERTLAEHRAKEQRYRRVTEQSPAYVTHRTACDLWTAAFFTALTPENLARIPTTADVRDVLEGRPPRPEAVAYAEQLAREHRFFHWPLDFADVLEAGGFDVVLSNPPWERIKLQETEFFAARERRIAEAANRAARQRKIKELATENPPLYSDYVAARHASEATAKFLRSSGRFLLTSGGDINTYSVFAGLGRALTHPWGS